MFFRQGQVYRIGAHDSENCQESDGCYEVTITEVWDYEDFNAAEFTEDLSIAKYV